MTKPIAKRLQNAASRAEDLSGKDMGNIMATATAPKIVPLTSPEITFDIQKWLPAVRSIAWLDPFDSRRCLTLASENQKTKVLRGSVRNANVPNSK